jgi:hypothetical protein
MQLVGCDRIQEELTRNRTGTTTPRERMPKRRRKATQNNGGYSTAQEGHGMQLVGCDRIQEELTRNRTGATTPRERMPKRRRKATQNNGGYSTAFIAAEAQRGMHLIRKPAKLTGNSHERAMYMGGAHQPDLVSGVGGLSRKRYTQYVEPNRTGHCGNKSENRKETHNGGDDVCYGAKKF